MSLEGKGPIFKHASPTSAMSGAEFAALVGTLPEAGQRKIEAMMELFPEDRSR